MEGDGAELNANCMADVLVGDAVVAGALGGLQTRYLVSMGRRYQRTIANRLAPPAGQGPARTGRTAGLWGRGPVHDAQRAASEAETAPAP